SRWLYWARPGAILVRSFVNARCKMANASRPTTRNAPRCDTSNTATPVRHARCSSSTPRYWIGISQPPNSPRRAPRGRRSGSSGLCRRRIIVDCGRGSVPVAADPVAGRVLRRRLEPVLAEELEVVALVEDPHADVGIELLHAPCLAVLLRDELLVQRRDLD